MICQEFRTRRSLEKVDRGRAELYPPTRKREADLVEGEYQSEREEDSVVHLTRTSTNCSGGGQVWGAVGSAHPARY